MGNPIIPKFDPERLARQIKKDRQSGKMPCRRKGGILVPKLTPVPPGATPEQRQRTKVRFIYDRFCTALKNKEGLTFYVLEDELGARDGGEWDRGDLIKICRYFHLQTAHLGIFDPMFWNALLSPGQHPGEAAVIAQEYDYRQVGFM